VILSDILQISVILSPLFQKSVILRNSYFA